MLNIRLSRAGKKNYAQYRIVVAEKTSPIKGRFVEQVGSYDPHSKKAVIKEDRVKYWISQGAGCSVTVHNLLVENGVIDEKKIPVSLKSKKKTEGEEEKGTTESGDNAGGDEKAETQKTDEDTGNEGGEEKDKGDEKEEGEAKE